MVDGNTGVLIWREGSPNTNSFVRISSEVDKGIAIFICWREGSPVSKILLEETY